MDFMDIVAVALIGIVILVLIGLLALLGVAIFQGVRPPVTGIVIEKDYQPASSWQQPTTIIGTDGNISIVNVPRSSDEKFSLLIEFAEDNETKTRWVYVPESVWTQAEIGCELNERTYKVQCYAN